MKCSRRFPKIQHMLHSPLRCVYHPYAVAQVQHFHSKRMALQGVDEIKLDRQVY